MKINNKNETDINVTVAEKAFYWITKLESHNYNVSDCEAFLRWLKKSPEHISEYIFILDTWNSLDETKQLDQQTIDVLMTDKGDNNVIALPTALNPSKQHVNLNHVPGWADSRFFKPLLTLTAILMISLTVLLYPMLRTEDSVYTTQVGEQRSWTLQDGSVLHLNTLSKIKIHYSEDKRLVELLEGEALFDVAHDEKRPFYVKTSDVLVRAVGTSFNIYHSNFDNRAIVITVVEGEIAVSAPDNETKYSMGAGKQLAIPGGEIPEAPSLGDVDLEVTTAWRQRKLVFRSRTLNEVVNEFNRYNRFKMLITSKHVGIKDITGIFDADKPEDLIKFLEIDKAIQVTRLNDKVIISDAPLN